MKLKKVTIRKFRNFLDSTEVRVCPDITNLVGKNESGKTAFLQALYRIKPSRPNVSYSAPDQYPAWLEKKDRQQGLNLEAHRFVSADFELSDSELQDLRKDYGTKAFPSKSLSVERDYAGNAYIRIDHNEKEALKHFVSSMGFDSETVGLFIGSSSFQELVTKCAEVQSAGNEAQKQSATAITAKLNELMGKKNFDVALQDRINEIVPAFFYYHAYSNLPYTVKIRELLKSDKAKLKDSSLTALSLLRLAAADDDYLLNPDYERRKRELENVANALTADVLKYWTQNPELRVLPDMTLATSEPNAQGQTAVIDELKIRIWDQRHLLSLPFDEHSTGFQWFFSFLAAFSEYEYQKYPVVILLDEPALGLHAKAQSDFLRFIEDRLAKRCQVLYTTHSPFMVQPGRLDRVRLVEDYGTEKGAVVSHDVLTTDRDTLFPLQSALGYDLAQHLFIHSHNLVVEGTSDFTYLTVLSSHLESLGKIHLDPRWSIVPVGGADLIPTFVALLGQHLEITVVVDSQKAGHQRLSQMAADGYLKDKRVVTIGEIVGKKLADVEDLFATGDYLGIYNDAFGQTVVATELKGTDRIIDRICRQQSIVKFDHGKSADTFLRKRDAYLPKLEPATIDNFERLFMRINDTLDK